MKTEKSLSHRLGIISAATLAVRRCRREHGLPFVRIGKSIRYRLSDIQAYIEAHLVSDGSQAQQ